ncbi:glycoside hydrolase family 15 [Actinomadura sp. WAC 06369]|uniref:glycoside hydrolase family 15 n=1 Tax=Actinomadura sp. WAC 06369 TaxID=2203193 RepID=UPI001F1F88AD|nr:glycoside hydrolase family 15 [Actinomadura sp. WAC 06369]
MSDEPRAFARTATAPGRPGSRGSRAAARAPRRSGAGRLRRLTIGATVAALVATSGAAAAPDAVPAWSSPGLVGGGGAPHTGVPLPPHESLGASYLPDSSVVRLRDGRMRLVPPGGGTAVTVPADDPRVQAAVRSDRAWLASGTVPTGGLGERYEAMSARALLDLRLLTRPNGASQASWYGIWRYSWPRDSAFAAAAFAVSGHPAEARSVLEFMARVQDPDGTWAARYHVDGSPVEDGRDRQLDALGWMLWATWFARAAAPGEESAADLPGGLWTMVRRAADHLALSLDAEGLPPASSDYWERDPRTEEDPRRPTLGVVGPVLAGLRSAAALAERGSAEAARWSGAADRLSDALGHQFAPYGYPRSPVKGGRMDTSVTFVAPPFAPGDAGVTAAIAHAFAEQSLPNGGVLPGEEWPGNKHIAWTPEVALFGLAAAASGRTETALERLDWLQRHRTSMGVLPEKVGPTGHQAGVAPLGWTASMVVLSLAALEEPLPIPPTAP